MNYGLENNKSNSIEQTPEVSEDVFVGDLVETTEISEDYDDCGVIEISEVDYSKTEFFDTYDENVENFDDCEINESMTESNLNNVEIYEMEELEEYDDCILENDESNLDGIDEFEESVESEIKNEVFEDDFKVDAETDKEDFEAEEEWVALRELAEEGVELDLEEELEAENEEIQEKIDENIEITEEISEEKKTERVESDLSKALKKREENADNIQELESEKEKLSKDASEKFEVAMKADRSSDGYKEALKEYNDAKNLQMETESKIQEAKKEQEELDKKTVVLREAQIQNGEDAMAAAVTSVELSNQLQDRFEEQYYENKPDKKELSNVMRENGAVISEMTSERNSVKLAMEAKMSEIRDYVYSNNLERFETEKDSYYQHLIEEYRELDKTYHRLDYNVIKLDENNIQISEFIGEEYESIRYQTESMIKEVADGCDTPEQTNYFLDETKAKEVLSPFRQNNWESLSVKEHKKAVEQLADYNAEILGIENTPAIVYYKKNDPTDFGGFSSSQHTIYINESNMGNAVETADTISHEYRHCYQHERAEKLETERDLEFKEGFDNYISPENDYARYRNQLVERDARDYAEVVKVKIISMEDVENEIDNGQALYEGERPNFETMNPGKGTVFNEVNSEELPQDFKKKIVEVDETHEIFDGKELQEIKERVSSVYENGERIAERIEEFNTYKEHHEIDGGHIGKVHDKSLQAADVMERVFESNSYQNLYSNKIDRKSLEMMALYHDTGMDGNVDADDFEEAKQLYLSDLHKRQAYVSEQLLKGKTVEEASEKFDKEGFESYFRKEHSVQSAIHALRDRDFIKNKGADADRVALGCLVHSKSNSGVTNLADEVQWQGALDRLKSAMDEFNESHPDEQIRFEDSFLKREDGTFDKESLAEMRSESLCLRIGDANGHDSKSCISQNGKKIRFSLDDWKHAQGNLPEDLKSKIESADCNNFIFEVQNANVEIDGIKLDDSNDTIGFSRMFAVGEGNFKNVNLEMIDGIPTQKFELENGDAYPMSTQFCILERLKEYNTAKINSQVGIERPVGMSDDAFKKYKEAQIDSMQKVDFIAEINIGFADEVTKVSYKAFADKVKDQYNIDTIIISNKMKNMEGDIHIEKIKNDGKRDR